MHYSLDERGFVWAHHHEYSHPGFAKDEPADGVEPFDCLASGGAVTAVSMYFSAAPLEASYWSLWTSSALRMPSVVGTPMAVTSEPMDGMCAQPAGRRTTAQLLSGVWGVGFARPMSGSWGRLSSTRLPSA